MYLKQRPKMFLTIVFSSGCATVAHMILVHTTRCFRSVISYEFESIQLHSSKPAGIIHIGFSSPHIVLSPQFSFRCRTVAVRTVSFKKHSCNLPLVVKRKDKDVLYWPANAEPTDALIRSLCGRLVCVFWNC